MRKLRRMSVRKMTSHAQFNMIHLRPGTIKTHVISFFVRKEKEQPKRMCSVKKEMARGRTMMLIMSMQNISRSQYNLFHYLLGFKAITWLCILNVSGFNYL